jgi:uncharacterized iron-regulated membrane protein
LLRRIFRIHFYAGVIAGPFLLLLSLTGLVILYTQPIQDLLHGDLLTVADQSAQVPLQQQVDAATRDLSGFEVASVIPAPDGEHSTIVAMHPTDSEVLTNVFVNPHTGEVLGRELAGNDVVGLANRLHGSLNNESVTVSLPSIPHLLDSTEHPDFWVKIPVGSLVIELVTLWTLVLLITGVYLWWPRSSQKSKPLLRVRWAKGGRLRWQDLHSASGILVAGFLAVFIVSGMPWSDYWGESWDSMSSKLTPNAVASAESTSVHNGDLHSSGTSMEWAGRDDKVPASEQDVPQRLDYTAIAAIASERGMLPGYSIDPPQDVTTDGVTEYGSYTLSNYWPQKLSERRTLNVDQFSGDTVFDATAATMGSLKKATSFGVNLHMGTQYGLLTRILATIGCLLVILSVLTSYVLWWKRRPRGTAGLPKRPVRKRDLRAAGTPALTLIGVTLAIIYPSFGATLVLVVLVVLVDAVVVFVSRRRRSAPATEQRSLEFSERD